MARSAPAAYKVVAVTGATGFIGAQVAVDLLVAGYVVHATVRRDNDERCAHLRDHPVAAKNLKVFEADLLAEGSFDAAFDGCDAVMHVASPFTFKARDPYRDVVLPAIEGTKNVLRSCVRSGVRKVVLTSSVAAIQTAANLQPGASPATEDDWSDIGSEKNLSYLYSKRAAEQAAWAFVEERPELQLVVINPCLVLGPTLNKHIYSESMDLVTEVINGSYKGILDFHSAIVDVRDVSAAHIAALENPTAKGRYICATEGSVSLQDVTDIAIAKGFKPPTLDLTSPVATAALKAVSYLIPGQTGQLLRLYIGNRLSFSNDKIRADLGISFRPAADSIADTMDALVKWGHLKKPEARS